MIPLREVVLVEKVDNTGSGDLGTDSLVVTTRGKVHLMLHVLGFYSNPLADLEGGGKIFKD